MCKTPCKNTWDINQQPQLCRQPDFFQPSSTNHLSTKYTNLHPSVFFSKDSIQNTEDTYSHTWMLQGADTQDLEAQLRNRSSSWAAGGFWSCQRCFWCDVFFGRQREWKRSKAISRVSCCCWCRFFFGLLLKVFVFFWFCFFFETWICQIFMFGVQMELINVSMKIGFYWWVDVNEGVSLDVAWWNCWKMKMENWCFLRPIV